MNQGQIKRSKEPGLPIYDLHHLLDIVESIFPLTFTHLFSGE